eukprot:GHVH01004240.1.p2 GENE.GHVH01004240.1~~GHVH01004240.1.p2  ORF type:complete len:168 (-),score=36.44 GHVH01004240.1:553-1056(-)
MAGKSKGKGGKNRRRGKNVNLDRRELLIKEPGQEYGSVLKMLGNGRVDCMCFDGEQRLCHIRGKMRKKVWIVPGDIVLVSTRDFQEERGDIIYKYLPDEARQLKQIKEIPDTVQVNEEDTTYGDVTFGEVSVDGEDEDGEPEAPKFQTLDMNGSSSEEDSDFDVDDI